MTDRNKLKDRARDELFSHINRCGVLQAAEEDQEHWMEETMGYLAERYPDLSDADLRDLYTLGLRFCRPAIPHGRDEEGEEASEGEAEAQPTEEATGPESVKGVEADRLIEETVSVAGNFIPPYDYVLVVERDG
jgi:hypothetical protein